MVWLIHLRPRHRRCRRRRRRRIRHCHQRPPHRRPPHRHPPHRHPPHRHPPHRHPPHRRPPHRRLPHCHSRRPQSRRPCRRRPRRRRHPCRRQRRRRRCCRRHHAQTRRHRRRRRRHRRYVARTRLPHAAMRIYPCTDFMATSPSARAHFCGKTMQTSILTMCLTDALRSRRRPLLAAWTSARSTSTHSPRRSPRGPSASSRGAPTRLLSTMQPTQPSTTARASP